MTTTKKSTKTKSAPDFRTVYTRALALITSLPTEDRVSLLRDLVCESLSTSEIDTLSLQLGSVAYRAEVRALTRDYCDRIKAGEFATRDALVESIEQTCDGHHDVIYTAHAQAILLHSDHSEAITEEGIGDAPNWSALAALALRADLIERLGRAGVDVDAEPDAWTPNMDKE